MSVPDTARCPRMAPKRGMAGAGGSPALARRIEAIQKMTHNPTPSAAQAPGCPHGAAPGPEYGPLRTHGRFGYRPITDVDTYRWPGGANLAVYLGFNIEHFAFGEGLGANLGPVAPQPDVLNSS